MRSFTQKLMMFFVALLCSVSLSVSAQTLNEGFENTSFPPADWSTIQASGSVNWIRSTAAKHAGSASAYVNYASSGHENYLVTPKLTPAADESLSFYVASESYAGTTLTVEVSTTDATAAAFTTVLATYTTGSSGTIGTTSTSSWVEKTIDLTDYVGQNIYIAFHVVDDYGSAIYVDDVTGVTLFVPSCPAPTISEELTLTSEGATITWTAGGSETSWQYVCLAAGADLSWDDAFTTTTPSVTLIGKTANTAYDFYVRAYCGQDDQSAERKVSFRTACGIEAIPYTNGFEEETSSAVPSCWTRPEGQSYPYVYNSTYSSYEGSKCLYFNGGSSYSEQFIVLPKLANAINTLAIQFYYKASVTGWSTYGVPQIGYVTNRDDMTTFVALDTLDQQSDYTLYELNLDAAPANAAYIAIRYGDGSSSGSFYLDNLTVKAIPNCKKPATLNISDITTAGATFTWTAGGSETNFEYIVLPAGAEEVWNNPTAVNNQNSVTLTTLTANTAYDFYVRAACGDTEKSDCRMVSFRTACDAVTTFPWSENFDDVAVGNIAIPCWENEHITGNGTYVFEVAANATDNATHVGKLPDMSSGTITDLRLPEMNIPAANAYEFFISEYRNASGTSHTAEGLRILALNGTDTFELAFISRNYTQAYTQGETVIVPAETGAAWYTYNFAIPCSGIVRIIVRGENTYGSYTYFDNLLVREIPSCTKPATLVASDRTVNGATLTWTAGGSETSFEYVVMPAGEEADWTLAVATDQLTVTLTTLTVDTDYDFYVRAACGETEKSEARSTAFSTLGYCKPAPSSVDNQGMIAVALGGVEQTTAVHATTAPYYTNNSNLTFEVAASTATSIDVTYATGYTYGTVIWVDWNNDMDFTVDEVVFAGTSASTNPTTLNCPFTVPATQPEGTYRLRIGGADSFFDNFISGSTTTANSCSSGTYLVYEDYSITVLAAPSCLQPTNVTVIDSTITASSATLTCVAGGSETNWYVSYKAAADEDWTIVSGAVDTPYVLNGLNANTAYQVRMAAACGNDTSEWTNPVSFRTVCEAVTEFPWSENFDGYELASAYTPSAQVLPMCWEGINTTTYSSYKVYPTIYYYSSTDYSHSQNNSLRLYSNYSSWSNYDPQPQYAILPEMTNLDSKRIIFWARGYNANSTIKVGRMADATDASTFVQIGEELALTTTYQKFTINLAGENATGNYIAIMIDAATSSRSTNGAYVDDITVEDLPSCLELASLTYENVTARTATLKWIQEGGAEDFQYVVALRNSLPDWENGVVVTDSMVVVTALSPLTAYDIYVRAYCSETSQSVASKVSFTTEPSCYPLASVTAVPARTKIQLMLNPMAGHELAAAYELVYADSALTAELLEAADKTVVTDSVYTITGLDRETTYYIYVRANCGDEDGVSAWDSTTATTRGLNYTDEIIVADGTATNSYLPIYGSYTDTEGTKMQMIYPANMLTGLSGITINSLHYFANGTNSNWTDAVFEVRMMQTETATMGSDFVATDAATLVYTGTVTVNPTDGMLITLATPFTYTEGNLLIEFLVTTESGYKSVPFYGITTTENQSRYFGYSASNAMFLPKVGFGYPVALDPCPTVTDLDVDLPGAGTTEAHVTWTAADADYLSAYEVVRSLTPIEDFSEVARDTLAPDQDSIVYTDLTAETHFYVYVRAICQAEGQDEGSSNWVGIDTTTKANCPELQNLALSLTATNAFQASWDLGASTQDSTFRYILSTTVLDEAGIAAAEPVLVTNTVIELTELLNDQMYYFYVASACGASTSEYILDSIKTPVACQAVVNLEAARVEHNRALITWNKAPFATETSWEIGFVGDEANAVEVDTTMHMFIGLTPETAYNVYVKALCGEDSESEIDTVAFTTASMPGACTTVGTSTTTTTSYGPIYSYYNRPAYTQQLYVLNDASAGTITSIALEHKGNSYNGDMTVTNYTIYMANTSATSLASGWITEGLTEVFNGTTTFQHGTNGNWVTIDLTTPFVWDGTSNIVVAVYTPTVYTLTDGTYDSYFYGTSASGAGRYYAESSGVTLEDNLVPSAAGTKFSTIANIQFCFEPKACPDVTALAISDIEPTTATATWEPMGQETSWNIAYDTEAVEDPASLVTFTPVNAMTYPLSGLEVDQDYWFYVQPVCEGADSWRVVHFVTEATCFPPMNLTAQGVTSTAATVCWQDTNAVGNYTVIYNTVADFEAGIYLNADAKTTSVELTGLTPETDYKFAVISKCDDMSSRPSATATFTTVKPYPYFMPAFTAVPSDWKLYSGLFTDTVRTANLTTTTSGWYYKAGDAAISTNHVKLNIYGTTCKYWFVSPAIDMTGADSTAELVFDAALCKYSNPGTAIESTTNVGDDKFAVIISRDGGLTWLAADRTLWAETEGADYQYTSVPATGQRYSISLAQYAGEVISVAFYGESTADGGDNDFHVGNISLRNTATYTEETCQHLILDDNHGFDEASTEKAGTFHFEGLKDQVYTFFDLTVHEASNPDSSFIAVDSAYMGDHFEYPYFSFTIEPDPDHIFDDGSADYRIDSITDHGCPISYEVYIYPVLTAEIIEEVDTFAVGESIIWHNQVITETGTYRDTVRTARGGAKEIYILHATKVTIYSETVCQGDEEFEHHGFDEASSAIDGTHIYKRDSVIFVLTVNPSYAIYDTLTLYNGDHYIDAPYFDFEVASVDSFDTTYYGKTELDCDSIIKLHIKIHDVDTIRETFEMPENDTIWHGITITEPGNYRDSSHTDLGGVDTIFTLLVTAPVTPVEGRTFELVTEQLSDWTGNYLIVFADNKAHAALGLIGSGTTAKDFVAVGNELTIVDNKITTADSCYVTITAMGTDGYSILLPDGNYLNRIHNGVAVSATAEAMAIDYTANGIQISGSVSGKTGTYYLYCNANNGTPMYRFYADKSGTAQAAQYALPQLYKEVSGEGPGTAIETIDTANEAVKVILNGNLYIIRDNQWYDATGRLTSDPRK